MNGKEALLDNSKKMNIWSSVSPWLATAGYMAFIFYLSSRHLHMPVRLPEHFDKLVHTLIYMPLGFLFFVSLKRSGFNRYIFLISFLLAGIYGITDELHQSFVPGRDASAVDAFADFFGAILGAFVASRVKS